VELEASTVDVIMGSHRIFSRGEQIKGLGRDQSPPAGSSDEAQVGFVDIAPETDDRL